MGAFKGNEGQDVTFSASKAELGCKQAVDTLLKVLVVGTLNTLTITNNVDGTVDIAYTLV
jgi:hypothetical protein